VLVKMLAELIILQAAEVVVEIPQQLQQVV
jgi:hypothetical protein